MLHTWQKTLLKGQNNFAATSSHLLVSGGVLGWLRGAKDLVPKDKNLSVCLLRGNRMIF